MGEVDRPGMTATAEMISATGTISRGVPQAREGL